MFVEVIPVAEALPSVVCPETVRAVAVVVARVATPLAVKPVVEALASVV